MTNELDCNVNLSGEFDRCIEKCVFLGNGCSGPRTTAMTFERWLVWIKNLRELRKRQGRRVTNGNIADACELSKNTVDNLFAGKTKDVSRTTCSRIEDFLIGGEGKWPCAMDLSSDKEVVYQDRPETLDALALREEQVQKLRANYGDLKNSMDCELNRVREEFTEDIREYKDLVNLLKDQIKRKDDYIDRLATKAGI